MNDEQVGRAIDELERALAIDDPGFVQRVRNVRRRETAHDLAVFVLLAAGVVLLTAGLASRAVLPWVLGLVAFLLAVAVDEIHKRRAR
jgi:hypothetical protein